MTVEPPKALYRKYRPNTWTEVSGQDHVIRTLQNAVNSGRVGHAYLFSGQRGTGKTSVARLLARAVNCLTEDLKERPCGQCQHCQAVIGSSFLDLIEIDAASNNGVEDVRDLRDKVNFSPNQGRYKVYIIDEVHMLSKQAFNALLKTLEEPPPHVIFILATTEIHKIPATVLSRCQRHEFKRASVEDITSQLSVIVKAEKIKVEDDALTLIARQATGSFRDAISLLDQMTSSAEKITLENVHHVLGTSASHNVVELVEAIQKDDPAGALDLVHQALEAGADPRQLARQIVDYLRTLLLIKLGNPQLADMTKDMLKTATAQVKGFTRSAILQMLEEFQAAGSDIRGGWNPSLNLELALAAVFEFKEDRPVKLDQPASEPVEKPPTNKQPGNPKDPGRIEIKKPVVVKETKPGEDDFSRLNREWKQVSNAVRSHGTLSGLLNSCRLISLNKGILTIGFTSDILRQKADTQEQIKTIQDTITKLFDMDVQIKCVVSKAKQGPPADIKRDGMVAEALKYGAKISDIQD